MMGDESPTLSYAGNNTPGPKSQIVIQILTLILLVLTCLAVFNCVRIEILNARAGYELPRSEYRDEGVLATWRVSPFTSEQRWREWMSRRDPTIESRPLTAAERLEMQRDVERERNRNMLLHTVETWGLLQYPLVVVLMLGLPICTFKNRRRSWRISATTAAMLTLICAIMMFCRGYYSSLG